MYLEPLRCMSEYCCWRTTTLSATYIKLRDSNQNMKGSKRLSAEGHLMLLLILIYAHIFVVTEGLIASLVVY